MLRYLRLAEEREELDPIERRYRINLVVDRWTDSLYRHVKPLQPDSQWNGMRDRLAVVAPDLADAIEATEARADALADAWIRGGTDERDDFVQALFDLEELWRQAVDRVSTARSRVGGGVPANDQSAAEVQGVAT